MRFGFVRARACLLTLFSALCLSSPLVAQDFSPAAPTPPADSVTLNPSSSTADLPARFKTSSATTSSIASDLFSPLPRDFKALGSSQNWLVAGIGGISTVVAHSFDTKVANATWPNGAAPVMHPGEIVGSFAAQTSGALVAYAAGRITGSAKVTRVGAELFRAQIVSQVTAQALKLSVDRTRPDGTSLSFPSGHSASMFATATVLQSEFGWKAAVPAYAVASWVAASRVQANRHYLSDVVAGATLGMLAGRSVTIGSGNKRFAMSPTTGPAGGLGVSFTKISKP